MILKKIRLRNFRNYKSNEIFFQNGIHFISGKNGQGKTNLLESMYFLSCTKSHRTNQIADLINKEENSFMIEGIVHKKGKHINMKCVTQKTGKHLFLYNQPISKVSEFIGVLNAVLFCPDDLHLFQGTPKARRKFIDLELSKLSKSYMYKLNKYSKLLKERNGYLKKGNIDVHFIEILNEQMIDLQVSIMTQRIKFIQQMIDQSKQFYTLLSEDNTQISYDYQGFVAYSDIDSMKKNMREKYENSLERDQLLKQTTYGIHKDDFIFLMNGYEVSTYASQGQRRSLMLALKLGIVESIYKITNTYPILLLDDVFSELDESRRLKLLYLLNEDIQIFISATEPIKIDGKAIYYYEVKDNEICLCKEE